MQTTQFGEKTPGLLYSRAVKKIESFLAAKGGASACRLSKSKWKTYLQAIAMSRLNQNSLSADQLQETKTSAKALDELGEGGLDGLADILTQRFKVLEVQGAGRKDLGPAIELVGFEDGGLLNRSELVVANKVQLREQKLNRHR